MVKMQIEKFAPLEYHVKEAFNTLCANLVFAGGDIKKILVTSCHPNEGKSFVVMNLARAMGMLGKKVVYVDADIRASVLQRKYGIQIDMPEGMRYSGLTEFLAGKSRVEEIIGVTNITNVHMILSGHNVINSLPLLSSSRLGELLNILARAYDVVLVDAPPVGTIIDAARISTACDGTVFVVESGEVSRVLLREAMQQIEKAGCPILGTVLNKFDEREYGSKYYHKSSYYVEYGNAAAESSRSAKRTSSTGSKPRPKGYQPAQTRK